MNRREWLKSMTTLAVGVAAAPSLLAVFDAHAAAQKGGPAPQFFSAPQHDTVTAVVDIIVPRTDTPGAVDAGVPRFIDQMFKDVYTPEEQKRYLTAMAAFEKEGGKPFAQLDAKQRLALVTKLHEQALIKGKDLDPESAAAFVLMTKKLATSGFFISQPGCTQVMQYMPVPGAYHGDIPLSEAGNGRAWAVETVLRI
jgi:hypothetical protein